MKKLPIYFLFFMLLIFTVSNVEATTKKGNIPDTCLPYDVGSLQKVKIWLFDYYDIDQDEEILIRYNDPVNNRPLALPPNYVTLNGECFEMAYEFQDRGKGWYEDVLILQSYSEKCEFDLYLDFINTSNIDQSFNVKVDQYCNSTVEGSSPGYNITGDFLNDIVSYYGFDNTLYDVVHTAYATSEYPIQHLQSGKRSNAINQSLQGVYLTPPAGVMDDNGDYTVSFWFNYQDTADNEEMLSCGTGSGSLRVITTSDDEVRIRVHDTLLDLPGLMDSSWHHLVLAKWNTHVDVYIDGDYNVTFSGDATVQDWTQCYVQSGDYLGWDGHMDELSIYSSRLNSTHVDTLYNSGNGFNFDNYNIDPLATNLPTIWLNASQNYTLLYDDYFTNYVVVNIDVRDPWLNRNVSLAPGEAVINGDYFDLWNYGTYYTIETYHRPYHFFIYVYACGQGTNPICKLKTQSVYINTTIGNVTQVGNFFAEYYLDENSTETFRMNKYFQYYENIVMSVPDTNETGVLNSSWNYSLIQEPEDNATYMVYLECYIDDEYYEYNFEGDLNISVECGNGQSYYKIRSHKDYGQKVQFTAYNNRSSTGDYTYIYALETLAPSLKNIPRRIDLEPNSTYIYDYLYSFGSILDQDIQDGSKIRLAMLLTIILIIIVYVITKNRAITIISTNLILYLLAYAEYIRFTYPILLTCVIVIVWAVKQEFNK